MRRLGLLLCGCSGAVATTVIAGLSLIRRGLAGLTGLPLSTMELDLVPYSQIVCGGWDISADDLITATRHHGVIPAESITAIADDLAQTRIYPGVHLDSWSPLKPGKRVIDAKNLRHCVESIRENIRDFRRHASIERCVFINVASVERALQGDTQEWATLAEFEKALDSSSAAVSPAMIYFYAAMLEGVPCVNFTPSAGLEVGALRELAHKLRIPVAGKDGKTGQTLIKTALAPLFRERNLHVDGWYSTNLLGNQDGLVLRDPDSLRSKSATKSGVLEPILGYKVEDHLVDIRFYRPRGDNKESWDNIDISGFLDQKMQMKINFLCRDSILAAPLVIELARLMDLAASRREVGPQDQFSIFFKAPTPAAGASVQSFWEQQKLLQTWLGEVSR